MLRLFVLLLLLANALYFAWSRGDLAALGFAPVRQDEPGRLAQQIEPQRLRLLGAGDLSLPDTAAAAAAECLRAGLFDEREAQALRQALVPPAWPEGAWVLEAGQVPARWIVYIGRLATPEALAKKQAELRARGVRFETLTHSTLEPGLSLGSHPSKTEAEQALAALAERGVRTARVVQEQAEQSGQWLRLPAVNPALRARLPELQAALAGKPLRSCP